MSKEKGIEQLKIDYWVSAVLSVIMIGFFSTFALNFALCGYFVHEGDLTFQIYTLYGLIPSFICMIMSLAVSYTSKKNLRNAEFPINTRQKWLVTGLRILAFLIPLSMYIASISVAYLQLDVNQRKLYTAKNLHSTYDFFPREIPEGITEANYSFHSGFGILTWVGEPDKGDIFTYEGPADLFTVFDKEGKVSALFSDVGITYSDYQWKCYSRYSGNGMLYLLYDEDTRKTVYIQTQF